jgi:large subunit ribosomal protein L17
MKRGNQRLFGREIAQRKAFVKGLLTALIEHGKIQTTEARAKTLKQEADKLVTRAKVGTLASRRLLLRSIGTAAASKLMADVAPRFATRSGGYTRVLKLGRRASDAAPMAVLEFVS